MNNTTYYDVAILGGGPGGYEAAIKAGQLGLKVCLVEEDEVGGTCLIRGCIPTKVFTSSVKILNAIQDAEDFGVEWEGQAKINISKIVGRKNMLVERLVKAVRSQLKENKVAIQKGRGTILSPNRIEVVCDGQTTLIESKNIIIATGSRPASIPLVDSPIRIDGKRILNSNDILNLSDIPETMLIIGGGAVGSEFASIFSNMGTKITVVEVMPHLIPLLDKDLGVALEREFKKKRIKVYAGTKIADIKSHDDQYHVVFSNGDEVTVKYILVSVGRACNTQNIGLENIGIELGKKGNIIVNERLETNVKGVYAVGDVTGGMMLAHIASQGGIIAAENIAGANKSINYNLIPSIVFSEPELSSVGLSEKAAGEKGYTVKIGRFGFRATGRAHTMNELIGEVKIVVEEKTDKLIGVHIIGSNATELIHEAAIGMHFGITSKDLGEAVHAHPTLSEAIMGAARTLN